MGRPPGLPPAGAQSCVLYVHLKEALSPPPSMLSTSQSERLSQGLQGAKGIRHRGKGGGDWELTDNALFSIPVSRLAGGI